MTHCCLRLWKRIVHLFGAAASCLVVSAAEPHDASRIQTLLALVVIQNVARLLGLVHMKDRCQNPARKYSTNAMFQSATPELMVAKYGSTR